MSCDYDPKLAHRLFTLDIVMNNVTAIEQENPSTSVA